MSALEVSIYCHHSDPSDAVGFDVGRVIELGIVVGTFMPGVDIHRSGWAAIIFPMVASYWGVRFADFTQERSLMSRSTTLGCAVLQKSWIFRFSCSAERLKFEISIAAWFMQLKQLSRDMLEPEVGSDIILGTR
jgi:hypothetical protein